MFWECLHHVGYYLDKIMAIEALSDSTTNFVGRSSPEDIREWEISYYSTFPDEIGRINTAILGQGWERIAPYYEDGQLLFPNYAGALDEEHEDIVDPFATFTVQLYWQVLGRARFPDNYDVSFVEQSRIFILGTGAEPDIVPERLATYSDPLSGHVYGAIRYDGEGAAENMLLRANAMKARSDLCDNEDETATLDDDCRSVEAGLTRAGVTAALLDWHEVLKTMVLVDSHMDFGDPYDP
jgi:hypothetical protein